MQTLAFPLSRSRSRLRLVALLAWLAAPLGLACAGRSSGGNADPVDPADDAGIDASVPSDGSIVPEDGDPPDAGSDSSATDDGILSFPQAVTRAFEANPDVYPTIPVRVAATVDVSNVSLTLAGTTTPATLESSPGRLWKANVPIHALEDGEYALEASATTPELATTTTATLVLARDGIRKTSNVSVQMLGTTRLHRVGEDLALTWTDRRTDSVGTAWLERIDGAGRVLGTRVALLGLAESRDEETLYARTAFDGDRVGVLFQRHGTPYKTHFAIVSTSGEVELAPVAIDPQDTDGKNGGEIVYDGSGFVAVWRTRSSVTPGVLWWLRVPDGGAMIGPVEVAASYDGDGVGDFPPQSIVGLATAGNVSLVTFVRDLRNDWLGMDLPKSYVARVTADGTVESVDCAGNESDLTFHREARAFSVGSQFLALWGAMDMGGGEEPPQVFYGAVAGPTGALPALRGAGTPVIDAVDDRDEPVAVQHPSFFAVLAWLDHRAWTTDPDTGTVQLYATALSSDLSHGDEILFRHARFFAGLSELRAIPLGTNVMLVWLDQRNAPMGDYLPEIWLETVWL